MFRVCLLTSQAHEIRDDLLPDSSRDEELGSSAEGGSGHGTKEQNPDSPSKSSEEPPSTNAPAVAVK